MTDVFAAISDPTRRAILRLVSGRQLPAGRIAAEFDQQRPAISKHLTILKQAGLLTETRRRQERLYAVRPGALDELRVFFAEIRPPDEGVIQSARAPVVPQAPPLPRSNMFRRSESAASTSHNPPPKRPSPQQPSSPESEAPPVYARPGFDLEFD